MSLRAGNSPRPSPPLAGLLRLDTPLSPRLAHAQLIPGKKDTQLEDRCEIKYNEKYKAWIPGDQDPDEWAKENLSAPPPPPTGGMGGPSVGAGAGPIGSGHGATGAAPQTPMPDPARFSPRGSARRNPRSRYVDTFNAGAADGDAPGGAAPPSAAPLRPPAPQFKIFTPTAAPQAAGDAQQPRYERPVVHSPVDAAEEQTAAE